MRSSTVLLLPGNKFHSKQDFFFRNKVLCHISANTSPPLSTGLPCENVLKVWFVVKADETVMIIQQGSPGSFLTDRTGKTLYFFTKDTAGTSTCPGTCLAKWPAFSADPVSAPSVLKPADFSSIPRADGVKQTAFKGRPLYNFADDAKPGDVKGEGFNTVWHVSNVSGITPVVTTPPTTVPTTVRTTSSSSGGYGGGY